ncbi:type II secretion system protein [Candidatus Woesebacteria bacterium]|nr:type II secretion system protein [Candidatus Woesebacteria bacterium]
MISLFERTKSGQSLIELLVVIALLAAVLPAIATSLISSREGKVQHDRRLEGAQLLSETYDALRVIREAGWSNIATNGTYHPVISGSSWTLAANAETVGLLTRQIVISSVYRDTNNIIVTSGGLLDPSTKKVVITVSWANPIASTLSSSLYLSRYLDNAAYTQTTKADFDTGTKSNVQTTNTAGGEVTLATNVKGKWCEPQLAPVTIDLPGIPRAVTATEGHVYVATGVNAVSSEDSFAHVLVANTDPPTFTLHGKGKGYRTNAVFGEPGWGYVATTNNTKEVVIFNLNQYSDSVNKVYQEAGTFNTTTNNNGSDGADADTIFVLNNRGYVTAGNYLYVFDLTSKTGSRPKIGQRIQFANSGDIAGEIYARVVGSKTYVFISIIGATVEEMKIADVTSYSGQWGIVGSINIEPNNCSTLESGQAVFVKPDGTRAYLSSVNDTTFKEFFVINTSNKSAPSLVGGFATKPPCTNGGGYEAGGMNPEQSIVVSLQENRALLVGTDSASDSINSQEYQVLDLTNEGAPIKCGGLQFDQGIFGVAGVKETDGDAYAYIITGETASELKVVQGGPDGNYVESGTFESATFDTGFTTAFNRFLPTYTQPANTTINFQVAIADPVSGSCSGATYNYVGPDGTSNTYFTDTSQIKLNDDNTGYENPARCFRYKAYMSSTDYNATPVLEQIIANYSP